MKKNILLIVIGILIGSIGVYASTLINSSQVSYKDTTVDLALDDLFNNSLSGKNKIAEAITNKGIETLSTDSYDTMASNIENISAGNPYLRYDGETGYIQALDILGNWVNVYNTDLPMGWTGLIYDNGVFDSYSGITSDITYVNLGKSGYPGQGLIYASSSGNNGVSQGYSYARLSQTVNISAYSTIKFNVTFARLITTSGVSPSGRVRLLNTTESVIKSVSCTSSGTLSLDISDLQGDYYIAWGVWTGGSDPGDQANLKITKIWLE